jgi:hypothetical protein
MPVAIGIEINKRRGGDDRNGRMVGAVEKARLMA